MIYITSLNVFSTHMLLGTSSRVLRSPPPTRLKIYIFIVSFNDFYNIFDVFDTHLTKVPQPVEAANLQEKHSNATPQTSFAFHIRPKKENKAQALSY